MTSDIIVYPDIIDNDKWQSVIDSMTLTLTEGDNPDKIVSTAELLVSGWPLYKIGKELGVSTKTVRGWLQKYPKMTQAVAIAKSEISKWRMEQMERQFISAVEKSAEILAIDATYDPAPDAIPERVVNAKLLGIQAQHSRWILGLFFDNKLDININIRDESPTLRATRDALDYITEGINSQEDEPIEGTIRVIDETNPGGPLVDENGDPYYGTLGRLDTNKDGIMCHICGKYFMRPDIHIRAKEGLSSDMYETVFMLSPGDLKVAVDEFNKPREEDREPSS